MTDPFHDEPGYLTELPEDLKLKRAATARRRRWRRRLTLGSLIAVVGAVVALVAAGLGGGGSDETQPVAKQAGPKPAKHENNAPAFPAGWKPHPGPVPVLAYHAIDTPGATDSFPDLFVSPQDFKAQMQWLDAQGYEAMGTVIASTLGDPAARQLSSNRHHAGVKYRYHQYQKW